MKSLWFFLKTCGLIITDQARKSVHFERFTPSVRASSKLLLSLACCFIFELVFLRGSGTLKRALRTFGSSADCVGWENDICPRPNFWDW